MYRDRRTPAREGTRWCRTIEVGNREGRSARSRMSRPDVPDVQPFPAGAVAAVTTHFTRRVPVFFVQRPHSGTRNRNTSETPLASSGCPHNIRKTRSERPAAVPRNLRHRTKEQMKLDISRRRRHHARRLSPLASADGRWFYRADNDAGFVLIVFSTGARRHSPSASPAT